MLNASEIMELQKLSGMDKFKKRTIAEELERSKLIELLFDSVSKSIIPKQTGRDRLTLEIHHGDIADYLIANGVTVQKWIPVTERLPEQEGTYLTYTEKERIHLDCFCIYPNHGTQFWIGGNGKVTHWMPLPEPPKGE